MNHRAHVARLCRWLLTCSPIVFLLGWFAAPLPQRSPLPEPIRAVQYFQPDANLRTFWNNLDLARLPADFDLLHSGGFNAIILMVPWGEFQTSVQPVAFDEAMFTLLQTVIAVAQRHGLWVILRVGTHELLPRDAQGGDYWAGAVLTNEQEFSAYRALFYRIARETRQYPRMLYF